MKPKIWQALLAEQFLRTWPFIAATLVLGVALRILFGDNWFYIGAGRDHILIEIVALCIAALCLLYTTADSDKLACHMPESLLRLPVPTFTLVLSRFLFNITVIATMTLVFVAFETVRYDEVDDWPSYPITIAYAFAVLQLCAYTFGRLGDGALGILTAVGAIFFLIPEGGFLSGVSPKTSAITITVCFLASWAIVHAQRQGRWSFALPSRASAQKKTTRGANRPFRSKYTAQLWFEVVRIRSHIPIVLGGFMATYFMFTMIFVPDGSPTMSGRHILGAYTRLRYDLPEFLMIATVVAGAFAAFQNYRLQFSSMSAFFYLRPISSAHLGAARILATFTCIGLACIGAELLTNKFQVDLFSKESILFILAMAWCGFWVVNGFGVVCGTVAYLGLTETVYRMTDYIVEDMTLSIIGTVVIVALLIVALRQHLILYTMFVPALVVAILLEVLYLTNYYADYGIPYTDDIIFPSLFYMFLALAPFATVPLVLHRVRHR